MDTTTTALGLRLCPAEPIRMANENREEHGRHAYPIFRDPQRLGKWHFGLVNEVEGFDEIEAAGAAIAWTSVQNPQRVIEALHLSALLVFST